MQMILTLTTLLNGALAYFAVATAEYFSFLPSLLFSAAARVQNGGRGVVEIDYFGFPAVLFWGLPVVAIVLSWALYAASQRGLALFVALLPGAIAAFFALPGYL